MNFDWGSGNNKQNMYFVFVTKTRHKPMFRDNGQRKKCQIYFRVSLTTYYSMVCGYIDKRLKKTYQDEKIIPFYYYDEYLTSISNKTIL